MHVTKLRSALMVSAVALCLASCKNDQDPIPVNNNPGKSNPPINSLYAALKPQAQIFTVPAGQVHGIQGANGTIIGFKPQSFKTLSGTIITSGNIKIELTEALTPGQMILNQVSTVTQGGTLLTSGGSINIVASLNGTPVVANNYSILFKQPNGSSNQPMSLFTGIVAPAGINEGAVTWSNEATNPLPGTNGGDTMAGGPAYYIFDSCADFNWINCDYFYSAPDPKTDVTVVMPDGTYNDSTTSVIVIFPALNMAAAMHHYNASTHSFNFNAPGYKIPVGANIKVVIMGLKNNVYFYELQSNITVTNGLTLTANPANTTLANIQAMLGVL